MPKSNLGSHIGLWVSPLVPVIDVLYIKILTLKPSSTNKEGKFQIFS